MCGSRTVTVLVALITLLNSYSRSLSIAPSFTGCSLPMQPANGFFLLNNFQFTKENGPVYTSGAYLTYKCYPGYNLVGNERADCNGHTWSSQPSCVFDEVFARTVINGVDARLRQFPWHVGIYYKKASRENQPIQICGGTIISDRHVITAAHCFYGGANKLMKKELFAVVADKLHRDFLHDADQKAQYREIKERFIPEAYKGRSGVYADDIALIVLSHPLNVKNYVRAANIDWSTIGKVVEPGTEGTISGWGFTQERGFPSSQLQYLSVPVVTKDECKSRSSSDFRKILTYDKFCAGKLDGSSLCRGDDGGGFITRRVEGRQSKYYLTGIVSVLPSKKRGACDSYRYSSFININRQLEWLKPLLQ